MATTWRRGRGLSLILTAAIAIGGAATPVAASETEDDTWGLSAKLTPSNPESRFFGGSVAIDGRTTVVASSSGSVTVFTRTRSGWVESAVLTSPNDDDGFGGSIAVDGKTILVGARLDDGAANDAGAVYVFRKTPRGWLPTSKLVPATATPGDRFGMSVSIEGRLIVVGSLGTATVFKKARSGWIERATLIPESSPNGYTTATDGKSVFVGGGDGVSVFEQTRSGWVETQMLHPSDGDPDGFGRALAVDTAALVVGEPFDDEASFFGGAAYVFERTRAGWTESAKLTASDAPWYARLGASVAIDGDTIVAGAWEYEMEVGAAYVFTRSGNDWIETQKLDAPEPIIDDFYYGPAFGWSVGIDNKSIIVGAPQLDLDAGGSGATYVFVDQ